MTTLTHRTNTMATKKTIRAPQKSRTEKPAPKKPAPSTALSAARKASELHTRYGGWAFVCCSAAGMGAAYPGPPGRGSRSCPALRPCCLQRSEFRGPSYSRSPGGEPPGRPARSRQAAEQKKASRPSSRPRRAPSRTRYLPQPGARPTRAPGPSRRQGARAPRESVTAGADGQRSDRRVPAVPHLAQSSPGHRDHGCLLYTSPSPRDRTRSRMPSSA